VSWPGADRAQPAGARQGRPPGRYRLTPRDRHAGFAEAHSAAFDMGGNLVAEVAVQGRAEPGGLSAATCRPVGWPTPASAWIADDTWAHAYAQAGIFHRCL